MARRTPARAAVLACALALAAPAASEAALRKTIAPYNAESATLRWSQPAGDYVVGTAVAGDTFYAQGSAVQGWRWGQYVSTDGTVRHCLYIRDEHLPAGGDSVADRCSSPRDEPQGTPPARAADLWSNPEGTDGAYGPYLDTSLPGCGGSTRIYAHAQPWRNPTVLSHPMGPAITGRREVRLRYLTSDNNVVMVRDPSLGTTGGYPANWYFVPRACVDTSLLRPPAGWTHWESLSGSDALSLGPEATSWGAGRLDVLWRAPGSLGLRHKYFDGGVWHATEDHGGQLHESPGAASWGPNRLDVFVTGSDLRIWQRWWDGVSWNGYLGDTANGRSSHGPGVASWGPGRLDVFVRGTDGQLYQRYHDGGVWSGWLGHGSPPNGINGSPAAVSWGPNRVDVFVRGFDDQLWHKWFDGTHWLGWEVLGSGIFSAPAVSSRGSGRLDLFYRDSGGRVSTLWYHAGWGGPVSLGPGRFPEGDPASASWSSDRIDLFARGSDGSLWHKSYTP